MAERCIYADDFLDLFHVASAGNVMLLGGKLHLATNAE